jgi:hypothetical protein
MDLTSFGSCEKKNAPQMDESKKMGAAILSSLTMMLNY